MLFTPLKPMLLTMKPEAFDDHDYIFEPKWDGWRILIHKQGERIEAFTRNGQNVTQKFPELTRVRDSIRAASAILDCEGVCIRDGRSVFDEFQQRGRLMSRQRIETAVNSQPATFVAFDVLMSDGRDHTTEPLIYRKHRLADMVHPSEWLTPTMFVDGAGTYLKKLTEDRKWEGIVAKRKESRYTLGVRSLEWMKIKNWQTIDTVILGYKTEPQFALVVGLNFPSMPFKPVATVQHGFTQEEKIAFRNVVVQLHTVRDKHVQWIEPRLCCRIRYLDRTENHNLQMAIFEHFVFDKRPDDCEWVS